MKEVLCMTLSGSPTSDLTLLLKMHIVLPLLKRG
jgi:hypothetical protein